MGGVLPDDAVGRLHYGLCGAVILLKFEYFQVSVVLFKIEDVLNVSPTESIDALRVIAHHHDVLVLRGQFARDQVLRDVSVLKLIHHHIVEAVLVLVQHIHVVFE